MNRHENGIAPHGESRKAVPLQQWRHAVAWLTLGALFAWWLVFSFTHISPFTASWDEVDFVLALDRFDLLAMQPHFPGYPYFVLGGMLVRAAGADPVHAYGILNAVLTALSSIPVWLLARRRLSALGAAVTVLIIISSPYLWIQSLRPMSEAAGIAVLWWLLWCWTAAMERRSWPWTVAVLFLFGLLMGIRLSFMPFGLTLVWLLAALIGDWREAGRRIWPRMALYIAAAALFQALWVAGLVLSEGSLRGFLQLAAGFASGHFSDWGGGIASTPLPFAERLLRFAGDNLLWTGWLARSTPALAAAAALLLAAVLRAGAGRPAPGAARTSGRASAAAAWLRRPPLAAALAVLASAYAAWALAAQNIDKPRHITPIIGVIWLLVLMAALQPAPAHAKPALRRLAAIGAALAVVMLAVNLRHGALLAAAQSAEQPAVYQLADTVRALAAKQPVKLYTWEETRMLQYVKLPPVHAQILTYDYFLTEVGANPGSRIYLTDHVLQGFEAQAGPLQDRVRKIAVFQGNPLFDPVYGTITLYEWIRMDFR
jgi:hypothetical protein